MREEQQQKDCLILRDSGMSSQLQITVHIRSPWLVVLLLGFF